MTPGTFLPTKTFMNFMATLAAKVSTETSDCPTGYDSPNEPSQIARREFCNRLLLTSSGLLVAASALTSKATTENLAQLAYPPLKIDGAERLMPGSSLLFNYPRTTDPAILIRNLDGEYYSYNQKCSHRGCSIYFDRGARRLECPCHRGSYDVQTGFVVNGPPTRPLDQIVLQMRAGGEVWAVGRMIGSANPNG
jgi:cytochrome b6-f complex iron-sulfur subunit